jgi:hypothetical protein
VSMITDPDPNVRALAADPIFQALGRANAALAGLKTVQSNKSATPAQIALITGAWSAAFANFNAVLNDPSTPEGPIGRATARRWLGR